MAGGDETVHHENGEMVWSLSRRAMMTWWMGTWMISRPREMPSETMELRGFVFGLAETCHGPWALKAALFQAHAEAVVGQVFETDHRRPCPVPEASLLVAGFAGGLGGLGQGRLVPRSSPKPGGRPRAAGPGVPARP